MAKLVIPPSHNFLFAGYLTYLAIITWRAGDIRSPLLPPRDPLLVRVQFRRVGDDTYSVIP